MLKHIAHPSVAGHSQVLPGDLLYSPCDSSSSLSFFISNLRKSFDISSINRKIYVLGKNDNISRNHFGENNSLNKITGVSLTVVCNKNKFERGNERFNDAVTKPDVVK